ncbi:hypothetical protein GOV05_02255 [Candidatus Woesearchaeota archaeon]|nr:hypothetical protein [Candidatus Woesearchaeota archaeon]
MKKSFQAAPLSSTFFLTSIFGFLISALYISSLSPTWSFAFSLIFVLMFISSMISMTKATTEEDFLHHLSIHEPKKAYKKKK